MKKLFLVKPNEDPTKAQFEVKDVAIPRPGKGEVLVKMTAAAVNPSDYLGWMSVSEEDPTPIGKEGAGVVVASGGGMTANRLVGKTVGVISFDSGTYAEYVCVDATRGAFAMDNTIKPEDAASFFVNPFTVLAILDTAASHGSKAFVHTAAASQLGQMLLKLATSKGMTVVSVVRRKEQVEILEKLGAEHIVCTAEKDWEQQLSAIIKKLDVKVAFDAIAGDMPGTLLSLLPSKGTCFAYGVLSRDPVGNVDAGDLIYRQKRLEGFLLGGWIEAGGTLATIRRMAKATRQVNAGLAEGGWAESSFVDTNMEDMHSKFVELWKGGFTGKKLRVRMDR
jgi:NADPH:quinone reductase-like Zn-dependent oxidoreductase